MNMNTGTSYSYTSRTGPAPTTVHAARPDDRFTALCHASIVLTLDPQPRAVICRRCQFKLGLPSGQRF